MKRSYLTVMCLLLCLMLILPVRAEETTSPEDSYAISAALREQLGVSETDQVIRMYSMPLLWSFANANNIEGAIALGDVIVSYIIVSPDGTYTNMVLYEGKYQQNPIIMRDAVMDTFLAGNIPSLIGDDVVVQNAYYLNGEAGTFGTAIYYRTNKGDFVYFSHSYAGEFLFPLEEFCEQQKQLYAASINTELTLGTNPYAGWNPSRYNINSEQFDLHGDSKDNTEGDRNDSSLWLWLSIPVVACAALACVLIIKKRKANPQQNG